VSTSDRKTILLVEDETNALSRTKMLQNMGYEVLNASSGEEALEAVSSIANIDLILMDVNLGAGGGAEIAQVILKDRDLPIVFLLSRSEKAIVEKTENTISYGCVDKDSGTTVLDATLRMAFRLHAAHQTIARTKEALALAQEASPGGTWDWDIEANTLHWSPEFGKILGLLPGCGADDDAWMGALHPEDRKKSRRDIQEDLGKTDIVRDYRIVRPDGALRWIRITGKTYYANGRPQRMTGLGIDITELKNAEEAARTANARLELAQSAGRIGTFDREFATDILTVSSGMQAVYGHGPDQSFATYENWLNRVHPDDRPPVLEKIQAAMAGRAGYDTEFRVLWPDGSTHWVEAHGTITRDPSGRPERLVGIAMDITARKESEAALRQREEALLHANTLLQNTFDAISDLVTVHNRDLRVVLSNWHRQDHISEEERKSLPHCYACYMRRDKHCEPCPTLEVFRTGRAVTMEVTNSYAQRTMEVNACPVFSVTGAVELVTEHVRDITEQKRSEDALRQNEASLMAAQQIAHIGSWEWDVLSDEAIWSEETFRIFGLEPGRLGTHRASFLDFVHPKDRQRVDQALSDALSGAQKYDLEYLIQPKSGEEKVIHALAETVREADGEPILMRGTVQDVTERKRIEEERETSETFLRLLNESTTKEALIEAVARFFQKKATCEAIGIRLKQDEDYPYYETHGFPTEFVLLESSLCAKDTTGKLLRDKIGHPVMECMCGNVIQGRFDPSKPFFSPKGSFWTNSTTELLATTTEEDRQARTRNRCNGEGYESVALIPLWSGDQVFGLIQLNDRQKGRFSPEVIDFWERLAGYLAVALAKIEAEEGLRASEKRYRAIFDNAIDGIFQAGTDAGFITVNRAMVRMHGYDSVKEMLDFPRTGRSIFAKPEDKDEYLRRIGENGNVEKYEVELRRKDGSTYWGSVSATAVLNTEGNIDYYEGAIQDITARKHLENQLRHAEKMEAVGTLAGGVAHDFNNILTVIMGLSEVMQMELAPDDRHRALVDQIVLSSQRAAELTQSLLAFSRKQRISLKPREINGVLTDVTKLLRRLLTEDIVLNVELGKNAVIMLDVAQIDQVLMNLATNARDAMPQGGSLAIKTDVTRLDEAFRKTHGFGAPGAYVRLSVSDSGLGMDRRTIERIFDPFFTTKEVGKGTGLGLASVYGIVKQHNGYITVKSKVSKGTTFDIYLPLVERPVQPVKKASHAVKGGQETILVLEDDQDVRNMITAILSSQGYTTLEAENGEDAISVFKEHKKEIALTILDVVMPGKNGRQVFDEIIEIEPGTKAIFMSGYTGDIVIDKGVEEEKVDFLQKPLSVTALLAKVREVIDR
jgi:PAS domain S-box-containing protein